MPRQPQPTPFLGPAYTARSKNLADQLCINLYPEVVDTKTGKVIGGFFGTPGLNLQTFTLLNNLVKAAGTGPIRGMHVFNDTTLYVVSGSSVYSIVGSVQTLIGSIGTQTGPIYWLDNGTQVGFSDNTNAWLITGTGKFLDGSSALTAGTNYAVGDVIYLTLTGATTAVQQATAAVQVLTLSGSGVATFKVIDPGLFSGNTAGATLSQASSSGSGSGFVITTPTLTANDSVQSVLSFNGGSGFAVGDTIVMTATGKTQWASLNLQVLTVDGTGSVQTFNIILGGNFAGGPSAFTQTSTSGSGTGFSISSIAASVPSAMYPIQLPFTVTQAGPTSYQDGFGLIIENGTDIVWQSNLFDLSIWQPLNFASIESKTGNMVAVANLHEQQYMLKETNCEIWVNAGLNGFAFQKLQGVFPEIGCIAPASLCLVGESLIWLAQNLQGQAIVARITAYEPLRISTHALEFAMDQMSTISDAIAFAYQQDGHTFYQLTFPTGNQTWVFDETDSEKFGAPVWHQRAWFNPNAIPDNGRHRANCFALFNGKCLVGDYQNGNIYAYDLNMLTDNWNPIRRVRSFRGSSAPSYEPTRYDSLLLDMETGGSNLAGSPFVSGTASATQGNVAGHVWYMVSAPVNSALAYAVTELPAIVQVQTVNGLGRVTAYSVLNGGLFNGSAAQLANTALVTVVRAGGADLGNGVASGGFSFTAVNWGAGAVYTPQMNLTWSDDGGHTFSNDNFVSAGLSGQTGLRVMWQRLGTTKRSGGLDRIFKVQTTDPIKMALINAVVNV